MITAFYKLLNNSLRVDLLVRIHTSKGGANVSMLADVMEQSGLGLSGVSQYLKQLEAFHVIRRERAGRYVNYIPDLVAADPRVRAAVRLIVANERKRQAFEGIFAALMNPFRARVVAAVASVGEISGEEICDKTNHQMKHLKRDLQEAVEAGLLDPSDSEPRVAVYRYRPPEDRTARKLVELCFPDHIL